MSDTLDFTTPSDGLDSSMRRAGIEDKVASPSAMPVFKVVPGTKIPVSSKQGKLWKQRIKRAEKQMEDLIEAWNEAIEYYNNDQSAHRDKFGPEQQNNKRRARQLGNAHSSTENVVFANIQAQLPILYSKNPYVSINSLSLGEPDSKEVLDDRARGIDKLVNSLFAMTTAPGINLKPKAKKAVLFALLTNIAWAEAGYTQKEQSSEQALEDLKKASDKLVNAKTPSEIEEYEAQLIAIEERIEIAAPSGPFIRIRSGSQVIVDPNCTDIYLSDANWVAIRDQLPTEYIKAVFAKENEDKEEYKSIYEPTHILPCSDDDRNSENNTSIFESNKPYTTYGYKDEDSFNKAKMTEVYYVWNKMARRLELYHAKNWTWPIWVWDDPYKLLNFYPLYPLAFHDNPLGIFAKGEVSYYLDQQDEINTINSEMNLARHWARRNVFYNTNSGLTQEVVEKVLQGPTATATPLNLPDGVKIEDVIKTITPPSTNFTSLFDKKGLYESIDRITAANEVARGGQFKTNTTNQAIEYYSSMGNQRMDMRLDAIEDFVAGIGWMVAQLCLRFMPAETVKAITNLDVTEFWKPIDNLTDLSMQAMTCVGGSSQKQNKQARKREAIEVGQILAQFVKAAPGSVTKVTLEMFSEVFDDLNVSEEDWDMIKEEAQQMIDAAHGGAPGQGQPGQLSGAQGGSQNPQQTAIMVTQALEQLPPNILKAIGTALAQGVPPKQILEQMMQAAGQGQQPTNSQQPVTH